MRNLAVSEVTRGSGGLQVTVSATIDDTRYRQSNGMEQTYAIVAADAWIDGEPWQPAIDANPLAAVDGTFDSATEQVSATIALPALAAGRHLLYVQGRNARGGGIGTAGTPNAVFIEVPEIVDDTIFENGFDSAPAR